MPISLLGQGPPSMNCTKGLQHYRYHLDPPAFLFPEPSHIEASQQKTQQQLLPGPSSSFLDFITSRRHTSDNVSFGDLNESFFNVSMDPAVCKARLPEPKGPDESLLMGMGVTQPAVLVRPATDRNSNSSTATATPTAATITQTTLHGSPAIASLNAVFSKDRPAAASRRRSLLLTRTESDAVPAINPLATVPHLHHNQHPFHPLPLPHQHATRVMDKLVPELSSQLVTRSPLLLRDLDGCGEGASSSSLLLDSGELSQRIELVALSDSSLIAIDSSTIIAYDAKENSATGTSISGHLNKAKFSFDFLNTPPTRSAKADPDRLHESNHHESNHHESNHHESNHHESNHHESNHIHEVSHLPATHEPVETTLLSLDAQIADESNDLVHAAFSSNLPPNQSASRAASEGEERFGHDAIVFPASFDEFNNPFSVKEERPSKTGTPTPTPNTGVTVLEGLDNAEVCAQPPLPASKIVFSSKKPSLTSSTVTSSKRPLPITITPNQARSRSHSHLDSPKRTVQFAALIAVSTPSKEEGSGGQPERRCLDHMAKANEQRSTPIQAEPRRTPLATHIHSASSPDTQDSPGSIPLAQLAFCRDPHLPGYWTVAVLLGKTSSTRDSWRIQGLGSKTEFRVASTDMCLVSTLSVGDEIFCIRPGREERKKRCEGPFTVASLSWGSPVIVRLATGAPYDSLKIKHVALGKDTFAALKSRSSELPIPPEPSTPSSPGRKRARLDAKDADLLALNAARLATPSKPSHLYGSIFQERKFLITVGEQPDDLALKAKYSQLIAANGGELLVSLPLDAEEISGLVASGRIYLLSTAFKRTPKFILAIVHGIPRVHFAWLEACVSKGTWIDPTAFAAAFLIEPPSGLKPVGLLMRGRRFVVEGGTKFKAAWTPILRALGGTVSASLGKRNQDIYVLAESLSSASAAKPNRKGIDWLIQCIIDRSAA